MRGIEDKVSLLLDDLCQNVGGEWLLLGGALALHLFESKRITHDIDIVPIKDQVGPLDLKILFERAKLLSLSPEQVNSAVLHFLEECEGWQKHLVCVQKGQKGKIFRPSLSLYMALKLNRGTAIDVEDVERAINYCPKTEFQDAYFQVWANAKAKKHLETHRAKWGF